MLTSVQQLGGALGVAALGTMFWHQLAVGATAHTQIGTFRAAASTALWIAVALIIIAAVLTTMLPLRAREETSGH